MGWPGCNLKKRLVQRLVRVRLVSSGKLGDAMKTGSCKGWSTERGLVKVPSSGGEAWPESTGRLIVCAVYLWIFFMSFRGFPFCICPTKGPENSSTLRLNVLTRKRQSDITLMSVTLNFCITHRSVHHNINLSKLDKPNSGGVALLWVPFQALACS